MSKYETTKSGLVKDTETGATGIFRTVGGRRIFIKEGQDLASAMKESGKFKKKKEEKKLNDDKKGAIQNINKIDGFEVKEYIGKYDEVVGHTVKVKTKEGQITLGIRETKEDVFLNNIVTQSGGNRFAEKGAGTLVMNNLKEYSDKTGKNLIVAGIVKSAEPFYDKFSWLKKEKISIYDDFGELFDDEDVNRIYKPKEYNKKQEYNIRSNKNSSELSYYNDLLEYHKNRLKNTPEDASVTREAIQNAIKYAEKKIKKIKK